MILTIKQFLTAFILTVIALTATAQKDPQIQEVSVRAPDNIKIDGQLNEWPNGHLQAYNATDRVFYTISNDDNNLYLAICGIGSRVSVKALGGGITLTISHSVEKKARVKASDNIAITFPLPQGNNSTNSIMIPVRAYNKYASDPIKNRKQIDSLAALANTRLANAAREIKVSGIKEIADSVISVYNMEGIKAIGRFENERLLYVYELAVPLKYLGLSIDTPTKFSYNIKLRGIPEDPTIGILIDPNTGMPNPDQQYVDNPTDFWGEYTLAKKP